MLLNLRVPVYGLPKSHLRYLLNGSLKLHGISLREASVCTFRRHKIELFHHIWPCSVLLNNCIIFTAALLSRYTSNNIIYFTLAYRFSMDIPDLSSEEGLDFLDKYLKDKSYCFGFSPSKADSLIWEELKKAPGEKYENLLRWYRHISSYGSERNVFPNSDIELRFIKREKEAVKPSEVNR